MTPVGARARRDAPDRSDARARARLWPEPVMPSQQLHEWERSDSERCNNKGRTGCARLLHGGSFTERRCCLGLVTTRVPRAVTEPPLQFSTVSGISPAQRTRRSGKGASMAQIANEKLDSITGEVKDLHPLLNAVLAKLPRV